MIKFFFFVKFCSTLKLIRPSASGSGPWVTEVFKSLADINPDFMKSYFTIKKYSAAHEMEFFWKYHQHALYVMEQIQFYFEHV